MTSLKKIKGKESMGRLYCWLCLFFVMFISACSGGSDSAVGDSENSVNSATGTIAFRIADRDDRSARAAEFKAACLNTPLTVSVIVYDKNGKIKGEGKWDCKEKSGEIKNIPVGPVSKVVFLAKENEELKYRTDVESDREGNPITVSEKKTTEILMDEPVSFIPAFTNQDFPLEWDSISQAEKYEIEITESKESPVVKDVSAPSYTPEAKPLEGRLTRTAFSGHGRNNGHTPRPIRNPCLIQSGTNP